MIAALRKFIRGFTTLVFASTIPAVAVAGELRILDTNGLIRITTDIKAPALITVRTAEPVPPEGIVLTNSNGLSADIPARKADGGSIFFAKVPEGIWKIDAHGRSLPITKIDVQ